MAASCEEAEPPPTLDQCSHKNITTDASTQTICQDCGLVITAQSQLSHELTLDEFRQQLQHDNDVAAARTRAQEGTQRPKRLYARNHADNAKRWKNEKSARIIAILNSYPILSHRVRAHIMNIIETYETAKAKDKQDHQGRIAKGKLITKIDQVTKYSILAACVYEGIQHSPRLRELKEELGIDVPRNLQKKGAFGKFECLRIVTGLKYMSDKLSYSSTPEEYLEDIGNFFFGKLKVANSGIHAANGNDNVTRPSSTTSMETIQHPYYGSFKTYSSWLMRISRLFFLQDGRDSFGLAAAITLFTFSVLRLLRPNRSSPNPDKFTIAQIKATLQLKFTRGHHGVDRSAGEVRVMLKKLQDTVLNEHQRSKQIRGGSVWASGEWVRKTILGCSKLSNDHIMSLIDTSEGGRSIVVRKNKKRSKKSGTRGARLRRRRVESESAQTGPSGSVPAADDEEQSESDSNTDEQVQEESHEDTDTESAFDSEDERDLWNEMEADMIDGDIETNSTAEDSTTVITGTQRLLDHVVDELIGIGVPEDEISQMMRVPGLFSSPDQAASSPSGTDTQS